MRRCHFNLLIALVIALMFVAALKISPAAASCGATSCFLVIGSQAGVPQEGMLTANLIYNYVNQGDLLDGTTGIIPEVDTANRRMIPNHHLETRTINQVYTLDLNYGLTDRFALALTIPYIVRSHRHFHFHGGQAIEPSLFTDNGLGDIRVTAKYNVLPTIRNLLVFGLGVDLPTGKTDTLTNAGGSGPEEPSIQLGRGQVGLVGSVYQTYELIPHRLGQFSSVIYRHTFKNNVGYQYGDDYLLAAGLNLLVLEKFTLTGQFNYRYVVHDNFSSTLSSPGPDNTLIADRFVPTTGSTMLAFSPGVTWHIRNGTAVYFNAQIPVVRDFNNNIAPDVGFLAGITHVFNLKGS
jgi:hypothetical protein